MHDIIEYAVTGKVTGISRDMDIMSDTLGSQHRVFGHDIEDILMLSIIMNAKNGIPINDILIAALIHKWLDGQSDIMKKGIGTMNKTEKTDKGVTTVRQKTMKR